MGAPIKLGDEANKLGGEVKEMSQREKAQLRMSYWVLFAVSLVLVASAVAYICLSTDKGAAAKSVFEFCKNFIPPIVTLVLGAHYVNKNNSDSE